MSNVDHAEIAKFEALAHRWWDRESEFKPLHDINPLRVNWIDERVNLAGKKVLDVGCGGGILSEAMAQRGATVMGIDMGEAPLAVAQLHQLESGRRASNTGRSPPKPLPTKCPSSSTWSPAWKCSSTCRIHPSVIRACFRMVKPGGQVFFSTINRNPKAYLFAVIGAEYMLRCCRAAPTIMRNSSALPSSPRWSRMAGLTVKDIIGLTYNPLTKHYKLANDVDVNYMIQTLREE